MVAGPVIQKDKSQVWYVCFEKDLASPKEQDFSLSISPFPVNDSSISFKQIFGDIDGYYHGVDTNGKIHWHDPRKNGSWTRHDWYDGGGEANSMVCMLNGKYYYIGGHNLLNRPGDKANHEIWDPYPDDIKAISIARYGADELIGVNPNNNLIKITLNDDQPIIDTLSTKLPLLNACALPSGQILGVSKDHQLHLWHDAKDSWSPINTSKQQEFLSVAVDYNNQLLAVGTDHQLYRLGYAAVAQNLLNVDLKGVSAEAGNGTRVSQVACHFGNVKNGAAAPAFQFKSTTQLNIVNHQGVGYAPLHFGVLDTDVMVKGEKNILKPYFLTKERVPITLGKDTTFTFILPYIDGNSLPGIGKNDEVTGISAIAQDGLFTAEPKKPDTTHHTWHFPFKASGDIVGSQIFEGVFEFSNIQVANYRGPIIIEITVKNLPGYWDSVFQIPIVIGDSSLTDVLALTSTTAAGGNTKANGSKIYFNTGGSDGPVPVPLISIEEDHGLNLFGTLPVAGSSYGQPVKLRRADLLIPEGRLAVGTEESTHPKHSKIPIFPEGSDTTLYVQGDSKLNGKLTVSGAITSDTDHQVAFDTNTFIKGWSCTTGHTYVRGSLQVGSQPNPTERLNVDENGNVTIGKGSLTVTNGHVTLSKTLEVGESATFKQPVHLPNVSGSLNVEGSFLVGKQNAHGTRIHWNKAGGHGATDLYNIHQHGDPNTFAFQFHQRTGSESFNTLLTIHRNGRTNINGALNVHEKASLNGGAEATGLKVTGWTEMHGGFSADSGYLLAQNGWTHIKCNPGKSNIPEDRGVAIGWNRTGGDSETNFYNSGYIYDGLIAFQFLQRTQKNQSCRHARELLTIRNNGRVGIGTNAPIVPLHVNGSSSSTDHGGQYMDGSTPGSSYASSQAISILAQNTICSNRFVANGTSNKSDLRIKTNINSSDIQSDLARLLSINIRNYTHIDHIKQGNGNVKGLVAQELEEVFPEAVSKMPDFIPDIYQLCEQFDIDEEAKTLTCRLKQPHGLALKDRVKLISDIDMDFFEEVTDIIDEKSFVVGNWTEKVTGIFVFGKEVDDFRTVDYTQVSMMGISAIQAMHKEMEVLKEENKELKQGYDRMKEENVALKEQLMNEMQSLRAEMEALKATTL